MTYRKIRIRVVTKAVFNTNKICTGINIFPRRFSQIKFADSADFVRAPDVSGRGKKLFFTTIPKLRDKEKRDTD